RRWLQSPDRMGRTISGEVDLDRLAADLGSGLFAGRDSAPWFLVGLPGLVADVYATGAMSVAGPDGVALGSGREAALAVLFDRRDEPARETVLRALRAACALDVWSGGGIDLWRVGDPAPERVES
ncbi:hypothetical protein, partial [Zavarzinia sp.]|uniref:hypothetical protein n=1 Tax=Zavarzinia sp. TaxID=2027920 RepID=UPI00356A27E0